MYINLVQKDSDIVIRLKEEMKKKGINAKKLAEKANVGASFVYDILNGNSKNPTINKLASIAKILDVEVSYLLEGKKDIYEDNNENIHNIYSNIISLKTLSLEASQSCNSLVFADYSSQSYFFQKEWIDNNLKTSPDNLFLLIAEEDYENLSIKNGDMIIIDISKNNQNQNNDSIFLIRTNNKLTLRKSPLSIVDNNKNNDKKEENKNSNHHVEIIGQIVWFSRHM